MPIVGFRSLNQAQLLHDTLYYPDVIEPQPWLIYFVSKPLVGSLEYVPTVPPYLRERPPKGDQFPTSSSAVPKKKDVRSFNDLLILFPMIARQMQPGLERLFRDFEISFERFKPLPLPPPSPSSPRSGTSATSRASGHSAVNGDIYKQAADESEIRKSLVAAITAAVDLFQRIDQSQLDLLASTTDLTGPAVDRLIERYVTEQLHETALYPRLCATRAIEDEELEQKIHDMGNVDLTQVGIPSIEQQEKEGLARRIARGIVSFEKIGNAKSPQSMVEHLLETARTLTKSDDLERRHKPADVIGEKSPGSSAVVTMNADMLVSLLLVVVIRAKVPNLHACLSYMRNFVFAEDVEQGEVGYILSTLEAVLFHIAQDHTLSAASRANAKLWKGVKQGDLDAVKKMLEEEDDSEDSLSSGNTSADEDEAGIPPESESPPSYPTEDTAVLRGHLIPGADNPSLLREATWGNGDEVGNSRQSDFAAETNDVGDLASPNLQASVLNGSVHISDAEPIQILTQDILDEDDREINVERASEDAKSLANEGPPTEDDVFGAPTSPTTGISNVRIEELRTCTNDDADSISSVQLAQTVPQKSTTNPRVILTRFNVQETRKRSVHKHKYGHNHSSVSLGSVTTISDISVSSYALSRTSTSQSQTRDAFSPEKLSRTRNPQGESILMMAVQGRKPEMLRYLLSTAFFDVDFLLADASSGGTTLLSAAVQTQDMALIDIFLVELLKLADGRLQQYLRKADSSGRTVAHYLFYTPDLIVRLGQWFPWRHKDKHGQTPLFALCRSYDHSRYREMVGMAIKQAQASQKDNAELHLDEHVDAKGNTLLHIAGDPAVVRMLLKCDSDVNAVNEKGFAPLMVASKFGRIELVRTLFSDARVDLLAKEPRGLTAVELAKDDDVRNRIDGNVYKIVYSCVANMPQTLSFFRICLVWMAE
jgi:hypothetical protein